MPSLAFGIRHLNRDPENDSKILLTPAHNPSRMGNPSIRNHRASFWHTLGDTKFLWRKFYISRLVDTMDIAKCSGNRKHVSSLGELFIDRIQLFRLVL